MARLRRRSRGTPVSRQDSSGTGCRAGLVRRGSAAAAQSPCRSRRMARTRSRDRAEWRQWADAACRRLQGVEQRLRRRSLPASLPEGSARPSLRLRPARRLAAPALSLPARCDLADRPGDECLRLSGAAGAPRAAAENHPHRLHRRLDDGRLAQLPVLLSRICRAVAESMGHRAEARRAVRSAERRPREHHLARHRRHHARGAGAARA